MSTLPHTPVDSRQPPRRGTWTRRMALGIVACILTIVITRIYWGFNTHRKLEAKIAEIRARGEPILVGDFVTPRVAEDDNAARQYETAASAIAIPRGLDFIRDDFLRHPDLALTYPRAFAYFFELNSEGLELLREARLRSACDWNGPWSSPISPNIVPAASVAREVAQMGALAALYAHMEGEDAEAVERVRDVLLLARRTQESSRNAIEFSIASGFVGWACGALDAITPSLRIAGEYDSESGLAAARSIVEKLITELLDESAADAGWTRAALGERCIMLEAVRGELNGQLPRGTILPDVGIWVIPSVSRILRPVIEGSVTAQLDACSALSRLSEHPDFASGARAKERAEESIEPGSSWRGQLTGYWPLTSPANWESFCRVRTERRLAALALAIRLYTHDHGELPNSLEELCPAYIPAIPRDPFSPVDEPMRYIADDSPRLYSLAQDQRDNGGWPISYFRASSRMEWPIPGDIVNFLCDDAPPDPRNHVEVKLPPNLREPDHPDESKRNKDGDNEDEQ